MGMRELSKNTLHVAEQIVPASARRAIVVDPIVIGIVAREILPAKRIAVLIILQYPDVHTVNHR